MKRARSISFLFALFSGVSYAAATPLCAQAAHNQDVIFEVDRKSPWTAGILETFIPTLGYGYADSWSDGVLPGLVRLGGAVAMLWGVTETLSHEPGDPDVGEGCGKKCSWGFAAMTVGMIWGVVGAVNAATDHNTAHGLDFALTPGRAQRGVTLGFRIGF